MVILTLLAAGAVAYPLFIFLLKPFGAQNDLLTILKTGIFNRLFLRPALNGYFTFEIFPFYLPFTKLANIGDIAALMNWPYIPLSKEVAFYRFGRIMNSPPPAMGAFYAQGGWAMIILGTTFSAVVLA